MSNVLQIVFAGVLGLGAWGAWWAGGWSDRGISEPASDPAGSTCLVGTVDCADDPSNDPAAPGMGMCAPEHPDCVDVVVDPDGEVDCGPDGCGTSDEFDEDSERAEAKALVGVAEGDLDPDVRIARRGEEQFALTEDYVLGRDTVELDADADGVYRVVLVTVELVDGPETYTAD